MLCSVIWTVIVLWLHLMAAIFWVGGQLFLVAVALPVLRARLSTGERLALAGQIGRRFALLSAVALAILVVTGLLNALAHGASPRILQHTEWGHVLTIKAALVVLMLCVTGLHSIYFGRRLEYAIDPADVAATQRRRVLQRYSIRLSAINLLLNLIIVGLAAWLAVLP